MSFYPIASNNIPLPNDRLNTFTDPYSMHDIISRPLEQLRELEICGRGTLYPVTKHLLPEETDSFTKKIIKVGLAPFTFLTMGVTIVADNLFQHFKDNHLKKLYENLQHSNECSKELRDSQSIGLQYFNSENYKIFEKECESNLDNTYNTLNQSKGIRFKLEKDFNSKLKEAQNDLNRFLEKGSHSLKKVEKILIEAKTPKIPPIRNAIKKLKSNLYFKSNIEISNDLEDIQDSLTRVAEQVDPKVKTVLFQKLRRFKEKMDSYIKEYSTIEREIRNLRREKACKESTEESLEIEAGPIKVKTSKKPKKKSTYDDCVEDLERKKSNCKESILETAGNYIKFLSETSKLLETSYGPAIIEQSHEKLKNLLQKVELNLNQYTTLFPKAEKEALEKELLRVNSSTEINRLISKCQFNYNNELSEVQKLIVQNTKVIKEVEDKLKDLESLSQHSPLKKDYQQKFIEKNESLKKVNSHLISRYEQLDSYKKRIFNYRQKFECLQLSRKKTSQEIEFNDLYERFDRVSREVRVHKTIDLPEICEKISDFYLQANKTNFFFL